MIAPAEHGDTPDLTEQERGWLVEATEPWEDALGDNQEFVDEVVVPAVARILSARSAATEDPARRALRDLVALKDGPRDDEYERRKPAAWQAARDALARSAATPDTAARPTPGPDAATALIRRRIAEDFEPSDFTLPRAALEGYMDEADRLAAASPAPDTAAQALGNSVVEDVVDRYRTIRAAHLTPYACDQARGPCALCEHPADVAKMRSNFACCTGCGPSCVCLTRDRSHLDPDTAAQALRDAADEIDEGGGAWNTPYARDGIQRWLRDRADRLDPGTRDQADQGGRA